METCPEPCHYPELTTRLEGTAICSPHLSPEVSQNTETWMRRKLGGEHLCPEADSVHVVNSAWWGPSKEA